jgi:hypothetical protein
MKFLAKVGSPIQASHTCHLITAQTANRGVALSLVPLLLSLVLSFVLSPWLPRHRGRPINMTASATITAIT